jgi:hypothetical protein
MLKSIDLDSSKERTSTGAYYLAKMFHNEDYFQSSILILPSELLLPHYSYG